MTQLRVRVRDDLAALWLPWCVARSGRAEIIEINHEPHRRVEAVQLRIGDLLDGDVRAALSSQPRADGRSSLEFIQELAVAFQQVSTRGRVVASGAEVFSMPEGPMLHEACHRACALYEAGLDDFELRSRIDPIFGPWFVYECRSLRTTT